MSVGTCLRNLCRPAVENRFLLSCGLSAACGIVLRSLYPIHDANPMLRIIALEQPAISHGLVWSYNLFLFSTPFLLFSILFSLAYVHLYTPEQRQLSGPLPPYPDPLAREDLFLVLGELHHPTKPAPSPTPQWLSIPERGLYTGICIVGATGSGKTRAILLPAMRQLFAYRAGDPGRRLSGVVLEVKGDLCRHVQKTLKDCEREQDYVEVSLTGNLRYNPLNNDADPYAQAFNIASVITAIWGKGKEPFWQQSYTDLVRYVIMLHRVRDEYVTMVDIFRTVISAGTLETMLTKTGRRFTAVSFIGVGKADFEQYESLLAPFGFAWNDKADQYIARRTDELEAAILRKTSLAASLYIRRQGDEDAGASWESVHYFGRDWRMSSSSRLPSFVRSFRGQVAMLLGAITSVLATTALFPHLQERLVLACCYGAALAWFSAWWKNYRRMRL
ncbi:MAG TPA: hypothetical protein VGR47_08465 [Terracidiphilus sp.]|nr:hypothetical protein [Terracidiphilus sp.]HEV2398028.1 hypothetical protein [Candidatus Sulfotelmatobacter sp.]